MQNNKYEAMTAVRELKEEITRHARSSSHSLHREVLQTPEAVARAAQTDAAGNTTADGTVTIVN